MTSDGASHPAPLGKLRYTAAVVTCAGLGLLLQSVMSRRSVDVWLPARPSVAEVAVALALMALSLLGPGLGATLIGGLHRLGRRQRVLACLACGVAAGLVSMLWVEVYNLTPTVFMRPLVLWGMTGELAIRAVVQTGAMVLMSWATARVLRVPLAR